MQDYSHPILQISAKADLYLAAEQDIIQMITYVIEWKFNPKQILRTTKWKWIQKKIKNNVAYRRHKDLLQQNPNENKE